MFVLWMDGVSCVRTMIGEFDVMWCTTERKMCGEFCDLTHYYSFHEPQRQASKPGIVVASLTTRRLYRRPE